MLDKKNSYTIQSQETIKWAIHRLTNIELNKTTSNIWKFLVIILFFSLFILWLITGFILIFIFMILIAFISAIINGLLTGDFTFSYSGNNEFIMLLIPVGIVGVMISGNYLFMKIKEKLSILKNLRNGVFSLYEKLQSTTLVMENIGDLENIITDIYRELWNIRKLLIFDFFFSENGRMKLQELWNLVTYIVLSLPNNLRSDLATRLAEQQQILESAKTEVEQNIIGTPEILALSEIQKTRLDRQIEQFEELQRVLVRV